MKKIIIIMIFSIYALSYDKVALVIGNENYQSGSLNLPATDAKEIGEFLEGKGFKVFPHYNLTLEEMEREIKSLPNQVSPNGVLLFYYSGHGSEVDRNNYLIPINDSSITDETELKYKSIGLDYLIEKMQLSQSRINIVMIDACRNNPFGFHKGSKGLTAVSKDRLENTFLVFAGAEKTTIPDDGLFRKFFIKYANKPLSLGDLFTKIRSEFSANSRTGIYTNDRAKEIFKFTNSGDDSPPQNITEHSSSTSNYMNDTSQNTDLNKCNKGYAESCTNYGAKYYMGWGVSKNYNIAMKYYQKGCDLGHGRACANLGLIYAGSTNGYINEDQNKAKQLYRKACNLDYIKGCKYLSELMKNSNIKQDLDLIKCNKGYAESCTEYGAKYYMGWGVSKNYNITTKYYQKGCDLGHGRACANLGLIYAGSTNGYINEDQNRAKQLYRRACNLGYKKGCVFYSDIR